jgi:hypothetical protein
MVMVVQLFSCAQEWKIYHPSSRSVPAGIGRNATVLRPSPLCLPVTLQGTNRFKEQSVLPACAA